METLMTVYIAGGFLLIIISVPLIRRMIKPNPFYGVRISQTLNKPSIWYEVNQYFGKQLFLIGIIIIFSAVIFSLIPRITVDAYALINLVVFIFVFTICLILTARYIKKLNITIKQSN